MRLNKVLHNCKLLLQHFESSFNVFPCALLALCKLFPDISLRQLDGFHKKLLIGIDTMHPQVDSTLNTFGHETNLIDFTPWKIPYQRGAIENIKVIVFPQRAEIGMRESERLICNSF